MDRRVALPLVFIFQAASCLTSVMPSWADGNSWAPKAPMQAARCRLGVAAVNGKIYSIGGDSVSLIGNCIGPAFGTPLDTTEEYNPTTDTWVFKEPMPTARCSFAIAVFQNKIYCIGGYLANRTVTGVNEVYDPATYTWQRKAPMPTPRMDLQANVVNGRIYLIGGRTESGSYLSVNEVDDPTTDTWTTKASPPNRITSGASAVANGKIYVLSTASLLDLGALIQSYDPEKDSWCIDASSPTYGDWSTTACATPVSPAKVVFFSESSTYIYNPVTKSWTSDTVMPTPRGFTGIAALNNSFFVIGGIAAPFSGYIVITSSVATNEQYSLFNDQPVNFDNKIHIRADGSIEPSTSNIVTTDKIHYIFTGNNTQRIIIERDNIVLDGKGYTLQGNDSYGIAIFNRTIVVITNLTIAQFPWAGIGIEQSTNIIIARNNIVQSLNNGIRTFASSNNTIAGNKIQSNRYQSGIQLEDNSNNNTIYGNVISDNYIGIRPINSKQNIIYHNNFLANSINAIIGNINNKLTNSWDNGYPSGGNYWSDYNGEDSDGDSIGDTPYILDDNNRDNYSLVTPLDTSAITVAIPDFVPSPNTSPDSQDTQNTNAQPAEPFPFTTIAIITATAAICFIAGLLFYFKRRFHRKSLSSTN